MINGERELLRETWERYFDALSSELFNNEISIEVLAGAGPKAVEANRLALQTLAYDRRDDSFEVACAHGTAHLPSVLRHVVAHPRRIAVDCPINMTPTTILVDDEDGTRTFVRIERPSSFGG
jgi:hypothetical protein